MNHAVDFEFIQLPPYPLLAFLTDSRRKSHFEFSPLLHYSWFKRVSQKIKLLVLHFKRRLSLLIPSAIHDFRFLLINFQLTIFQSLFNCFKHPQCFPDVSAVNNNVICITLKVVLRIGFLKPFVKSKMQKKCSQAKD